MLDAARPPGGSGDQDLDDRARSGTALAAKKIQDDCACVPASFDGPLKLLGLARPARYRDTRQMQGAVIATRPYCL